jgi:hypothetical protein
LDAFLNVKRAFDPVSLLNPNKAIPTLQRCAEYGKMHVKRGMLKFANLPRFRAFPAYRAYVCPFRCWHFDDDLCALSIF